MIRRLRVWLRRDRAREGSTTDEVQMLLKDSEAKMHEAEAEAEEAEELTASLREMRVRNQFKERMVLKIQGGLR